jgi:hypothetical protein
VKTKLSDVTLRWLRMPNYDRRSLALPLHPPLPLPPPLAHFLSAFSGLTQLESIRSLMEDQSEALRSISASETQLKSLYDDLHRAKEMLQMDKTFLQKEVSELVTKDHQNQRVNETQATKIIQLDAKVLLPVPVLSHYPPCSYWS